jgi:hypothetical protein
MTTFSSGFNYPELSRASEKWKGDRKNLKFNL